MPYQYGEAQTRRKKVAKLSFLKNDFFVAIIFRKEKEEEYMKNTKVTLFSLAMVAVLAACNNTPKKTYNITLINPEDTSMVTSNVKQYIHDMRMQEIQYQSEGGDIYKIWDLYGDEGIDIDEDHHKISDENRVYLDTGDVNGKTLPED